MQLEQVPRLDGPASGSGCHSAAGLATVSGGAFTRIEVPEAYTEPVKRPGRVVDARTVVPCPTCLWASQFAGGETSLRRSGHSDQGALRILEVTHDEPIG